MEGIILTTNMQGGEADLTNNIASLGRHDAPLFSMIPKAVPSTKAKTSFGHEWEYENPIEAGDTDGFEEGSAPAPATTEELGSSKNHYQIFKETYGESGSAEGSSRRDGKSNFANEGSRKAIKLRLTVEKGLFTSTTPVQRVNTVGAKVKGKLGGLPHYHTAQNSYDAVNEPLSIKLLREYFKLHWMMGVSLTEIHLSDVQKDVLDDIYETITRSKAGQVEYVAHNIMMLKNFVYAPNVKVIMGKYVADDEIVGTRMDSLALVHQRLAKTYDIARTEDAKKKEIITELTLRVNHPFATGKLHGLKTA